MSTLATEPKSSNELEASAEQNSPALTDGFHLVVDALKLNGIDTIYGVPGIPITDLARLAQAEGIRFISFRHEASAGNAAAIAGRVSTVRSEFAVRAGRHRFTKSLADNPKRGV